ncbi:hypothetical protein EVAR_4621_1 [Eumeta japonica]|uniref:Uncharacterized protein n=1 Tax=Eumeta variegata TaxID=151549 RepID=A0A4C1SZ88_EUMVA|nr:hypothetical protein EVAR_4621_1 [Eumeta japonica]
MTLDYIYNQRWYGGSANSKVYGGSANHKTGQVGLESRRSLWYGREQSASIRGDSRNRRYNVGERWLKVLCDARCECPNLAQVENSVFKSTVVKIEPDTFRSEDDTFNH